MGRLLPMLNGRQKPGQEVGKQWPSMAGRFPRARGPGLQGLHLCAPYTSLKNHPNLDSEARTARSRGSGPSSMLLLKSPGLRGPGLGGA